MRAQSFQNTRQTQNCAPTPPDEGALGHRSQAACRQVSKPLGILDPRMPLTLYRLSLSVCLTPNPES